MNEVTSQFKDLNPEDRIFEIVGVFVKVKTLHDDEHSGLGQEIYRLSGSVCGQDGKALDDDRGTLHVYQYGHTCTIQAASSVSLLEALEPSTTMVVQETMRAYENFKARKSAIGIGSASDFKRRNSPSTPTTPLT